MRNYILIALLLGVIAVSSVSFLAQAEPKTAPVTKEIDPAKAAAEPAAATATGTAVTGAAAPQALDASQTAALAKATGECIKAVDTPKEGKALADNERMDAIKACLKEKGMDATTSHIAPTSAELAPAPEGTTNVTEEIQKKLDEAKAAAEKAAAEKAAAATEVKAAAPAEAPAKAPAATDKKN